MPVYRCGICNVFSSSLEQHARHLNGARHKRNEASALAGTVRAASNGDGKGAKRARRDAAAVAACLATLDGAAPIAGLPPLRDWLLRRDAVRSAPRIPRRFGGDARRYADSFRHAMAAEAFDIIDRSLGAGGEVADHDVLRVDRQQRLVVILHREHIYQDAFVRFLCGESAVALLLDESKPGERAFRCREGTDDAFFEEMGRRRTVRVEYLESVVSLIRADDALRRAFRREPPPVALALCRDGGRAAPEKRDDSDPWRAATDASGRPYFYHAATRETRWTRPTETTADWISDAVLSAVGDVRAPAPRQALDTTISLIHGPPGTGKTKELAALLLASKGRVLACAPSNRAVIELLDRFRALGRRRAVLVGVGSQVETHVTYASCRSPGSRDAARFSEILFCTLATAGRPDLRAIIGARELLVVDEAGQALEPEILSAAEAAQARRCVLCGDPMQLPPTVLSAAGVEAGLASSPMERLLEVRDASVVALRFLDEQRRMHPAISAFPNATYYGGRVRDAPTLLTRPRPDWLPYSITKNASPLKSRTVVDVAHGEARHDGPSLRNESEVDAIDRILSTLFQRLPQRASVDVAVISFYKAQIQSLERALAPIKQRLGAGAGQSLRIGTVDAFQGSEADVVIISAVRAGTCADVGFVADERRLNVALTRARHVLFFVCHAETLRAATHRSTAGALVATDHVRALMADADARGDVVDSALLL
ncbi:unnamed protein product [Pelagomonas calceolata]|uniref:WW domain-containing protein n=1 Tax=Pelagomonas calceolata TaxID=35677 RepID=A0A8J2SNI9_9STRA|nr:unnamed protein product [Pelagomonas calceolata]